MKTVFKLRINRVREKGATMIELALILVLFLAFIFAFIDFSRYFAVKATLTRGCQRGVNFASTQPTVNAEDNSYNLLLPAIQAEALIAPKSTFFAQPSAYSQVMHKYARGTTDEPNSNVLVLRPGEVARRKDPSGNYFNVTYPITVPADALASTMQARLNNYPVYVEMTGTVYTTLPFLPDLTVRSSAFGYREPSATSRLAEGPVLSTTTTLVGATIVTHTTTTLGSVTYTYTTTTDTWRPDPDETVTTTTKGNCRCPAGYSQLWSDVRVCYLCCEPGENTRNCYCCR